MHVRTDIRTGRIAVPQISPQQVAQKRAGGEPFFLLDVREPHELARYNLGSGVINAPHSRLTSAGLSALPAHILADRSAPIVVFCRCGLRSRKIVDLMLQNGWTNVRNMKGGINAYRRAVV